MSRISYCLGLLWTSKCTVKTLLHDGAFILLGACSSLKGLFTKGLGKQQRGMSSVIPTILLFLFCHLHYTGKRREIRNLKKNSRAFTPKRQNCQVWSVLFKFHWWNVKFKAYVFSGKICQMGRNFREKQHILHLTVCFVAWQRIHILFSKFTFVSLTKLPALHSYGKMLWLDSNSSGSKADENGRKWRGRDQVGEERKTAR